MQSSYVRSSKTVDPLENVAVVVNNVNGGVIASSPICHVWRYRYVKRQNSDTEMSEEQSQADERFCLYSRISTK